ncbi:MAG: hypothetical protein R2788_27150 [Saprospiraceae bacterium]
MKERSKPPRATKRKERGGPSGGGRGDNRGGGRGRDNRGGGRGRGTTVVVEEAEITAQWRRWKKRLIFN